MLREKAIPLVPLSHNTIFGYQCCHIARKSYLKNLAKDENLHFSFLSPTDIGQMCCPLSYIRLVENGYIIIEHEYILPSI